MVGLPVTLSGEEGAQAAEARAFAERLAARSTVPVETYDERFTTTLARRTPGRLAGGLARGRSPARELPERRGR